MGDGTWITFRSGAITDAPPTNPFEKADSLRPEGAVARGEAVFASAHHASLASWCSWKLTRGLAADPYSLEVAGPEPVAYDYGLWNLVQKTEDPKGIISYWQSGRPLGELSVPPESYVSSFSQGRRQCRCDAI